MHKQNSISNLTFKSNPDSVQAKESRSNISSSRKRVGAIDNRALKLPPIYDKSPQQYSVVEIMDDSSNLHVKNELNLAMFPELKRQLTNKVKAIKYQSRGDQQFNDSDSQDNGDDGNSSEEATKGILSKLERKEQLLNE